MRKFLLCCVFLVAAASLRSAPDTAELADGIRELLFKTTDNTYAILTMPLQGATRVNSSAYESSKVLKAAAGSLISLVGYNSKTNAQFIQLFDSATVPADGAIPILTFTVPAQSNFSLDIPLTGLPCASGISVSNSSTGPTKTIGSADCYFTAVVL